MSDLPDGYVLDSSPMQGSSDLPQGYVLDNYQTDPVRTAYQGIMNNIAAPINSAVGSVVNAATSYIPQGVKDAASELVQKEFPIASKVVPALMQAGKNQVNDLSQYNPDLSHDLPALSQNAQLLGSVPMIGGAAKLAIPAAGMASEALGIPAAYEKFIPAVQNTADISSVSDALETNKNIGYDNAKTLGAVLTPSASDHVALSVPAQVESDLGYKLDDKTHPQTLAMMNNLQAKAAQGLTTTDLENTRKGLNNILNGSASGGDRNAAIVAKRALDNVSTQIEQTPSMLVNNDPSAIQAFRDARAANGVSQRYSDIANIVSDARSNPQKIQSAFQKLVSSKKENDFNLYAPDEQAIIQNIAYPNGIDTKLDGGGLGSKLMHAGGIFMNAGLGAEAGSKIFGESGAAVGGILGAAKGTANALGDTLKSARVLKGADDLLKTIASKSKTIAPIAKPTIPAVGTP